MVLIYNIFLNAEKILILFVAKVGQLKAKLREAEDDLVKALAGIAHNSCLFASLLMFMDFFLCLFRSILHLYYIVVE